MGLLIGIFIALVSLGGTIFILIGKEDNPYRFLLMSTIPLALSLVLIEFIKTLPLIILALSVGGSLLLVTITGCRIWWLKAIGWRQLSTGIMVTKKVKLLRSGKEFRGW